MITIKTGDVIRYIYKGEWEYRTLTTDDGGGVVKTKPPPGTEFVIEGHWKRDETKPSGWVFKTRKIVRV